MAAPGGGGPTNGSSHADTHTLTHTEDPSTIFQLIEKLGEGSYGEVYTALDKRSKRVVAIKVIPLEADMSEFQKEIDILRLCASTYIVSYMGSYTKDGDLWIVMEFCGAGSVADLMAICDITLNEEEIAEIMAGSLKGLEYLHSMRIIHRDLKAGNILLTEDGAAKLADFGVSAQLSSTMSKRRTVIGTPYWMPPEVIQESAYDFRADVWSLGITAIELADGEPPYAEIHPMRAIFLIPSREPPTVRHPEDWSPEFLDFIKVCLRKDFTKRPTATELLSHPFIRDAAARLEANGGKSPLLEELVSKCLPLIQQARKEDNDADAAAEAAAAAKPAARPEGVGRPAGGATFKGTMRKAAGTVTGTMVKDGKLVKKPTLSETMRRARGDEASGTMLVTGTMRAMGDGGGGGTFVYSGDGEADTSADAEDDSGASAVPAFMQHIKAKGVAVKPPVGGSAAVSAPAPAPATSTSGRFAPQAATAAVPAPVVAAPPKPRDFYDSDADFLRSFALEDLQDRLYDLDSQFRRDMAALTEKYDAARSAIEAAIAEKEG